MGGRSHIQWFRDLNTEHGADDQGFHPPDGAIRVLLVDDNERWVRYLADELNAHDSEIEASVVHSANEAVTKLRNSPNIDCVVSDYQMPEIDGLQLLERIQEERSRIPFIIVTGEGNEDVASRAINYGVSDYLVKNPRADQTSLFVNKIRTAVTHDRLQRAVVDSEERYRTLIDKSQDAIAIFRDETLVFWNQQFTDLVGIDDQALTTTDFLSEVVHPTDHDDVDDVLTRVLDGEGVEGIFEMRLVTPDDRVRFCEYTVSTFTEDGVPSILVSIRDVTERKRRERELIWEREFNRTLQRALVESRTREHLEQEVAAQLCRHWYDMTWFGDVHDGRLVPLVVEGDSEYLDSLDLSIESDFHDTEPSLWAVQANEAKFVRNFEDLFSTEWQQTALDCGYRSGAAVPLVYNDVAYGVLSVYQTNENRFDETERDLLTDLGETVAFAIHNIETKAALASEYSVKVTVHLRGTGYYLAELARDLPITVDTAALTVLGTIPQDDEEFLQYVTLDGIDLEDFIERAEVHPHCVNVTIVDEDRGQLQIRISGSTPEAILADRGIVVRTTEVQPDGAKLTFELPAKEDIRPLVKTLEESFGSTSIQSIVEQDPQAHDVRDDLTVKQAAALEAAYHHGYFDQPRRSSATEVAEDLGVAHSTFLYHLRTAQRKVFGVRFS